MSFKGVWIPVEVLKNESLTLTEKLILGYGASFKGPCFASNDHISKSLGIPEKTVRNALTALRKRGVIRGRTFPRKNALAAVMSMSRNGAHLSQIGASDVPNRGT